MWVLMSLPVALAILYSFIRPGYMNPLVETTIGRILFGSSVILYGLGYLWMKSIVDVKV
jgi:tight adherence protein B